MPLADPNKIWPKLEALGVDEVRRKLASGAFAFWKRPTIEEWIRMKEKGGTPDTFMYHETHAPAGKIFPASHVPDLEKAGWVDSPAKFTAVSASGPRRIWHVVRQFAAKEWKWIIGIVLTLAALFKCVG